MLKVFGVILVLLIAVGYIRMIQFINRRMQRQSRVAQFKVGGPKFSDRRVSEETTEERRARKQVSLREGSRLGRRWRGR